jgi:hypothetical protein
MPKRAVLAGLAALLLASTLTGQSLWVFPEGARVLFVEYLHPDLDFADDRPLTGVAFLGGRFALTDRVALQLELPVVHLDVAAGPGLGASATRVGNPYVGGRFRFSQSAVWIDAGVRIPIGEDTGLLGLVADIDRWDAWAYEVLPMKVLVGRRWVYPSGAFAEVRGGPVVFVDIGDAGGTDGLLNASVLTGLDRPGFLLAAGVSGMGVLTGGGSFEERTLLQAGVVGEARLGRMRPGALLVFPVDADLRQSIEMVLGLRLGVVLP